MSVAASVGARTPRARRAALPRTSIPWITVAPGAPYFVTEHGAPWTPVGQNDAITWPELAPLFRRRDLGAVEAHLAALAASGVTCLRMMLEYCQGEHRYLERPFGRYVPAMVRLWDDLFALCEGAGLRILLTPFDTFFTWRRWGHHPYNRRHGGPCATRTRLVACAATRAAVTARLRFATERWGASGALFAWDLWNELHPAHGGDDPAALRGFVDDVSGDLRAHEERIHGRAHPQTVSVFGPELARSPWLADVVFRHPTLDFASSHFYEHGTIDDPRNTVDAAVSVGRLVAESLGEIRDARPFFDSEHGPIHTFKDRHRTLPAAFDDEYFRHIQWAHLAAGGAGGGMRWPNRHPHQLTPGMRAAQRALAAFLPLIDWPRFRRRPVPAPTRGRGAAARFAVADDRQAVAYLLRTDVAARNAPVRRDATRVAVPLALDAMAPGRYRVTEWDTVAGAASGQYELDHQGGVLTLTPAVAADLAVAVRRLG